MRYPYLNRTSKRRVIIPQLKGGINAADHPSYIGDDQLTAAENMYFAKDGLRTRPGICYAERAPFEVKGWTQTGSSLWLMGDEDMGDDEHPNVFYLHSNDGQFEFDHGYNAMADEGGQVLNVPMHDRADCFIRLSSHDSLSGKIGVDATRISYENGVEVEYFMPVHLPTVLINSKGSADPSDCPLTGTLFEGYNMLSDGYKVLATADGKAMAWKLPRQLKGGEIITVSLHDPVKGSKTHTITVGSSIDRSYDMSLNRYLSDPVVATYIKEGASQYSEYKQRVAYDAFNNCIVFVAMDESLGEKEFGMHIAPLSVGAYSNSSSNMSIEVTSPIATNASKILGMKHLCWFGGSRGGLGSGTRLFAAGNPDCPGVIYWSDLNDPTYFPENNYAYVGNSSPITALAQQADLLVIFQQKGVTVSQYVQGEGATSDRLLAGAVVDVAAAAATFPMTPLHSSIGCDCPQSIQLCSNRLVWLSSDGRVHTLVSYGQYNERNVRQVGYLVSPLLRGHSTEALLSAKSADLDGKYCLFVGNKVYVMDYDSPAFKSYTAYSADSQAQKNISWYEWTLPDFIADIKAVTSLDGMAVIVTADSSLYYLSLADGAPVADYDGKKEYSVPCKFETKHFVFGSPDRLKNIDSVLLSLGKADALVRIDCLCDGQSLSTHFADGHTENEICRHRIYPNADGVADFALKVQSEGCMSAEGLTIIYKEAGDIS